MLSIDLQNAFEPGRSADNFTVLLLRLIGKSDSENRAKFRKVYPVEVRAVEIYQGECPYTDEDDNTVDWEKIAERAEAETPGATGRFPEGKIAKDDEGELRIAIGVDSVQKKVLVNFGKSVTWFGMSAVSAKEIGSALIDKAEELAKEKVRVKVSRKRTTKSDKQTQGWVDVIRRGKR